MDTKTDTPTDSPGPLFNPLTGWEAASRWNSAAFEWMTKGWQQWLTLMTTSLIPEQDRISVTRAKAPHARPRSSGGNEEVAARAVAKATEARPKRTAPKRRSGAAAKPRSRS